MQNLRLVSRKWNDSVLHAKRFSRRTAFFKHTDRGLAGLSVLSESDFVDEVEVLAFGMSLDYSMERTEFNPRQNRDVHEILPRFKNLQSVWLIDAHSPLWHRRSVSSGGVEGQSGDKTQEEKVREGTDDSKPSTGDWKKRIRAARSEFLLQLLTRMSILDISLHVTQAKADEDTDEQNCWLSFCAPRAETQQCELSGEGLTGHQVRAAFSEDIKVWNMYPRDGGQGSTFAIRGLLEARFKLRTCTNGVFFFCAWRWPVRKVLLSHVDIERRSIYQLTKWIADSDVAVVHLDDVRITNDDDCDTDDDFSSLFQLLRQSHALVEFKATGLSTVNANGTISSLSEDENNDLNTVRDSVEVNRRNRDLVLQMSRE